MTTSANNSSSNDRLWQTVLATGRLEGRKVSYLETTPSTNTVAMAMARNGEPAGSIVMARTQTKGRGRLGKSWLSPPDSGLYFSMIVRPRLAPQDLPKITLAAGLATCLAIEAVTGLTPRIKWPNDLLLDDRKMGGILSEAGEISTADRAVVVVGIGINVSTPISAFPADLAQKTTSLLAATGVVYPRGALLAAIIRQLDAVLLLIERNGFSEILAQWRARDATRGRLLTWVSTAGQPITGISLGPDDNGLLHIQDQAGTVHEILSGDINLARP